MTLAQRAGCVLDPARGVNLGMPGAYAAPLAELLQFFNGIFAGKGEYRVEHRRHMARVEKESVACNPCGVVGVGDEELRVKHVYEIGSTHCAARVS